MTDNDPDEHAFSEGQGFDEPYEGFDIDPPELDVGAGEVDPVDSRVLADALDDAAIPDDRVDVDRLLDVGIDYMGINRHEQAAETFERAARYAADPEHEQEAWVNKGAAHAELEEWDAAIGAYREALDSESSAHDAEAETNLAYALYEFGREEEALEHAERAVEADERFPQAWFNRGVLLLERGLSEQALDALENAIRLGLSNAEVHEAKAEALEELGREDAAQDAAERADELRAAAQESLLE
jgi:tetratricopeptide (TPR) repeat protein